VMLRLRANSSWLLLTHRRVLQPRRLAWHDPELFAFCATTSCACQPTGSSRTQCHRVRDHPLHLRVVPAWLLPCSLPARVHLSNASLAWVVRAELCGGAVVPQLCLSTASTTRSSSQISEDDCFVLPLPFSLAVLRSIPGLQRSRHARSERCSRGVRTTTSRSERVKRTANTGVTYPELLWVASE
jgi:hypothetical protein